MNFGEAIELMKQGQKMARHGWNGKGIYVEMQFPDEFSKMTGRYIFINTSGLITENESAPKNLVPWTPSQTDMICDDWGIVA